MKYQTVNLIFSNKEWPIFRQTPNEKGVWKNYRFFLNNFDIESDYLIVYGGLDNYKNKFKCPIENTIFITTEPASIEIYKNKFIKQFNYIFTCQQDLQHSRKVLTLPGLPWFVCKNYDELINTTYVKKSKKISIVCSSKKMTNGHDKRLKFCMSLKNYFGNAIDFFGRGISNFDDKWEVLAPYKYSLAIENSSYPDYLTEKIFDCYLSHTFPLYFGAPNIEKYFSRNSFMKLDINDLDDAKIKIDQLLTSDNHYHCHLDAIFQAKYKCLNEYQLFPLITNFIEKNNLKVNIKTKQTIDIFSNDYFI